MQISIFLLCSWLVLWCSACTHKHYPAREGIWPETWQTLRKGKSFGISGMALFEQKKGRIRFLVVHDNKKPGQGRIAIVTVGNGLRPQYTPLMWPETVEHPVDMEALTGVPGEETLSFMALTSKGKIYHLQINANDWRISILKVFSLPNSPNGKNFEGFALHRIKKRLLAVWADRGGNYDPATIYWGWLNLHSYSFSVLDSATLKVPWPTQPHVRHITDIKISSEGVAIVTSASDPGDRGPFQSGAYTAGIFYSSEGTIAFKPAPMLSPFCRFNNHKAEALEFVNGKCRGIAFATDDEHFGSSIRFHCSESHGLLPK